MSVRGRALARVLALALAACTGEAAPEPEPSVPAAVEAKPAPVARVSTTDAWLDLIAQRPAAVVVREGRVLVDLASETARKHTELAVSSAWAFGREIDGRTAAVVSGRGASLEIPLDGSLSPALHPDLVADPSQPPQPQLAMAITLRALAPEQSVTVLWNERPLVNLRVSETWERRTISIPQAFARSGENEVRLHFRKSAPHEDGVAAAAVELIEVGTRAAITSGPVAGRAYRVDATAAGGTALRLEGNTALVYYLVPPRRARLRLDVQGRGSLRVLIGTDEDHARGVEPTELHQEPLRETGGHSEVDLSGYAGEPTRVELRLSSAGPDATARFSSLDIVARRNVAVDRRPRARRDVYVLAVEGLRADELLDPDRRPSLPNVSRMAAQSLVFERAYALGAAAVPSHAALLASVVPSVHLTVRGTFVAEGQTLLPEVLERAGYFTIGVSANIDVDQERGLVQGIDDQRVVQRSPTQENNAVGIVARLLEQIEQRPAPRFGYLTLSDPQAPYDPPAEMIADVVPLDEAPLDSPAQHLTHMWVGRVRLGKLVPTPEALARVRRLYRGELQVVDAALGDLFDALERRGELDDTVVVLVGIHGEEFYEHHGAGHGRTLFEESIRVPLLIRAPALFEPVRVTTPVDLLDVAPTLADVLGLEYPSQWQGRSLVRLADDPHAPPELVVAHLGDGSRAAIVGTSKVILGPGRGPGAARFFDLGTDPGETAAGQPLGIAYRMVRTALAWQLRDEARWKRDRWGTGAALEPAFALDHGM